MKPWCGLTPRAWQPEAVDQIEAEWSASRNPLVYACTGSGKTLVLAELAARESGSVLVTVPTQALVEQTAATLGERMPGQVGRAYGRRWEPDRRVVVVCNDSLDRLLVERPSWGLWLGDEAHRLEGERLREVRPDSTRAAGFTATPFRHDGRGMVTWGSYIEGCTAKRALVDGLLVPIRAVRCDGTGTVNVDRLTADWLENAQGPGVICARSIEDAESLARMLPGTAAIHSRMPTRARRELLDGLYAGDFRALIHVDLLTEGIDLPWLRWVNLRRPMQSKRALVQLIGRVIRASPGKTEAVIYDPHDLLRKLGLEVVAQMDDEPPSESKYTGPTGPRPCGMGEMPEAEAVSLIEGMLTDLRAHMARFGVVSAVPTTGVRRKKAHPAQISYLNANGLPLHFIPHESIRYALTWLLPRAGLVSATELVIISRDLPMAPKARVDEMWSMLPDHLKRFGRVST